MTHFKNILVALDLTKMDKQLIKASEIMARQFRASSIRFVHVIPSFVLPDGVDMALKDIFSPSYQIDLSIEKEIREEIKANFDKTIKLDKHIEVKEGPTATLLEQASNTPYADLVIVGRKKISGHSGSTAKSLARKVKGAVLFVPENSGLGFNHILVPVDFSIYSQKALSLALAFQKSNPSTTITAVHVIDYPPNALYLTGQYGLLAPGWKKKVIGVMQHFIQQAGLKTENIQVDSIKNDNFNISAQIAEHAKKIGADAIIMGARGHSGLDDIFLGSVTEKLVALEEDLPVLIVRIEGNL
ncbi:MAG: universal stress protein [Lewinellaceae bacterium]|nr:universal stress protein [Saprospiraceae bacterium]MCB9340094.1 universal stress protein [Lewinellaceae bacterium]